VSKDQDSSPSGFKVLRQLEESLQPVQSDRPESWQRQRIFRGWQVLSGETGLGICKETPVERWARRVGVEREGERAEDMLFAPRNVFFREIKSVSSSLSVLSASLFLISIRGGMLHAPPHQ
jgi:hypothetical protein